MAILSKRIIIEAHKNNELEISPFREDQCKSASYDLNLGGVLQAGKGTVELQRGQDFLLEGGSWALLMSEEVLHLPIKLCATYGVRHSIAARGLIWFGGPQVDPGYRGKLFLAAYNPTLEPIVLRYGDPTLSIAFHELVGDAEPYKGRNQDLMNFPSWMVERMMKMKVKNLSEAFQSAEDRERIAKSQIEDIEQFRSTIQLFKDELKRVYDNDLTALKDETKKLQDKLDGFVLRLVGGLIVAVLAIAASSLGSTIYLTSNVLSKVVQPIEQRVK